jgi:Na+/proline symporter
VVALMVGIEPVAGDHNNLIPQMASSYLGPVMIGVFFIMVIGSLSSTADSDLAALSSIMMTDIYGKNLAKGGVNPATMLWVGRITMIVATTAGLIFASFRIDILSLLVFVGALWGSIVFPVIASFYWKKVTNRAFTTAVLVSLVAFTVARFQLLPIEGAYAIVLELFATVGAGVVLGLMTFGFFGKRAGLAVGAMAVLGLAPFTFGFLREYPVLLSSLNAYGVSTVVCSLLSMRSKEDFDFAVIAKRVRNFDAEQAAPVPARSDDPRAVPTLTPEVSR